MTARKLFSVPVAVFAFLVTVLSEYLMDFAMWIEGDDQ